MLNIGRAAKVAHIHLQSNVFTHQYPPYALAAAIQSRLQRDLLDSKMTGSPTPMPTILSFTPPPTYTLGRRQTVGPDVDVAALRRPLVITHPRPNVATSSIEPIVLRSPRGGLTTYHGPGQVVIWPIMDLQPASAGYKKMGVREYADLLQDVTADLVLKQAGTDEGKRLKRFKTCDPGVWVVSEKQSTETPQKQPSKIAAMGVHLRRHVTGLGVALNLVMPGTAINIQYHSDSNVNDETNNPWLRFVPCGLEGKDVTSLFVETDCDPGSGPSSLAVSEDPGKDMAASWARIFAQRLGLNYTSVPGQAFKSSEELIDEAISMEAEMRVGCVGGSAFETAFASWKSHRAYSGVETIS